MRPSSILAGIALAASTASAQYLNQSAPFSLIITSSDPTTNGSSLITCHEGAGIEGLCFGAIVAGGASTYTFNYSASVTPDPNVGVVGLLTYLLQGGNFNESSPMELAYNPASNVAVPMLTPSISGQEVGFDKDNKLFIAQYVDDTKEPSTSPPYNPMPLYRWYVCTTYEGYTYTTLAWALGSAAPQNPTCKKVDVVRVFA